jgi:hypothetical protein
VNIYGSGFSDTNSENHVKIGVKGTSIGIDYRLLSSLPDCLVLESNSTYIKCQLPFYAASVQSIFVTVDGKGIASGIGEFSYKLAVTGISQNAGSFGGATVFIYGDGFSTVLSENTVTVGYLGNATIVSATYQLLEAILPPVTYDVSFTIRVTVGSQANSSLSFHYTSASTPTAKLITSTSIDSTPYTLIINGTGFDSQNITNNVVSIGSTVGVVTEATATQITVFFKYIPGGKLRVNVEVVGKGFVVSQLNFTRTVKVDSYSPSSSSYAGGREITIQGNGFSTVAEQNQVFFCNSRCIVKNSTGKPSERLLF